MSELARYPAQEKAEPVSGRDFVPGQSRAGWLFSAIWLVYLAAPLGDLFDGRHSGLEIGLTLSAVALFWTIPTSFLSEQESAGSIAFISSVGQIGSLMAPTLFGYVSQRTGSFTVGASIVAGVLIAGGCAVLSLKFLRQNQGLRGD